MQTSQAASEACRMAAKQDLQVLSQEIDEDRARYRVRAGCRVHYVTIFGSPERVFDEDTLCRPYLLIPKLPSFPDSDWTKMTLGRDKDGNLHSTISQEPLSGIENWHPNNIEIISLPPVSSYNHRVREVKFQGGVAMAKIAPFDWWNPQADRETLTYEIITNEHPSDKPPIAPTFLAQLTEQGRVMGFLLEKVQGRPPKPSDLGACEASIRNLHALGLVHGDLNRHNFIIEDATGNARIIDFEHASVYTEEKGMDEIASLQSMFSLDPRLGSTDAVINLVGV